MAAEEITGHGVGKPVKKNISTKLSCQKCSIKFETLFSLRAHSKNPHPNKEMGKEKMPFTLIKIFKDILSEHDREILSETKTPEESERYQEKETMGKSIFYPLVGTELSARPWQLEIEKYMY